MIGNIILYRNPGSADKDDHCPPGSYLLNIADGLLHQLFLGGHSDHRHILRDQGDGPVLELARCVRLRMYIGYLLKLKGALHAQGIIQAPSYIKKAVGVKKPRGRILTLLLKQYSLVYDLRHISQLFNQGPALLLCDPALYKSKLKGQKIHHRYLNRVGLGGSHGDLRSRMGIYHHVGLSCYAGALDVYDRQGIGRQLL